MVPADHGVVQHRSVSTVRPTTPLPAFDTIRIRRAEAEYAEVKKSPQIAYGLWCVVGIIGGHRFYLGDTGRAIAMLFTLGGLGAWTLADVVFIGRRVRAVNRTRRAAVFARHRLFEAD